MRSEADTTSVAEVVKRELSRCRDRREIRGRDLVRARAEVADLEQDVAALDAGIAELEAFLS